MLKRPLKTTKNLIAVYSGIATFLRYLSRHKAIILTYHLVHEDHGSSTRPICSISASEFLKHIRWISKHYEIVPLSTIVDCILTGNSFPKKCLAITFDDGFSNFLNVAYPVLKKYRIPIMVYLATSLIGTNKLFWFDLIEYLVVNTKKEEFIIEVEDVSQRLDLRKKRESVEAIVTLLKKIPNKEKDELICTLRNLLLEEEDPHVTDSYLPLTWDEARELCDDPLITIGSHTKNHVILSSVSGEELKDEVVGSKELLQKHIPYAVEHFSYPNGQPEDFDERSKEVLREAGYRSASTTIEEFNSMSTDVYELRRFGASLSLFELIPKISGLDNFIKQILSLLGINKGKMCNRK